MLDDDSLLNVFYLYRPFLLGEDDDNSFQLIGGRKWDHGLWWYNLAHVCQRWRNVILGSVAYLGVSLVCTNGAPVANMLAHSPPLPLLIDYSLGENDDLTAEDEEGVILAIRQYARVRRIRLLMPAITLQKLIAAIDEEYPILEYLIIGHLGKDRSIILVFPETLQAPHLRHLALLGFGLPTGSRLLATAVGLVTLFLVMFRPSTYFHPTTLLQWVSFMPQLETLFIEFSFPIPDRDVERQITHTPVTPVTLPNLHFFKLQGARAYLEALVHRIITPRLEKLEIAFFNQPTISVPRLRQFINIAENFRFKSAKFKFLGSGVVGTVYPNEEVKIPTLSIAVNGCHLDWQVFSVAQIFNFLSPMFSAVEHLSLEHWVHSQSSEEHNEADHTEWLKLLMSFRNLKVLRIAAGLVEELSLCLQPDDGELPLEFLPELQELTFSGSGNIGDAFTSFVNARQKAGCPITLVRL